MTDQKTEHKWVGFSRSLWASVLPIITLVLTATGVTGAEQIGAIGTTIVNAGAVVASAVLEYMHLKNPAPTSVSAE